MRTHSTTCVAGAFLAFAGLALAEAGSKNVADSAQAPVSAATTQVNAPPARSAERGAGTAVFTFSGETPMIFVQIPDANPVGVATAIIVPPVQGVVLDVDIVLDINHTCIADLDVTLVSPGGTTAEVIKSFVQGGILTDLGCPADFVQTRLDDEAPTNLRDGVPPYTGSFNTTWKGADPLSTFDGELLEGAWTLAIADRATFDVGTLVRWRIEIQYEPIADSCASDVNGDGLVNSTDLATLLGVWGPCR